MPDKGRRQDSSLHGFPRSPQSTAWGEILPGGTADPEALHGRLLVLYGRFIHQFFRNVLGLHGDALKDATQDFFLHVIEKGTLQKLRRQESFRGFLRLACRRYYLNRLESSRAQRRDVRREESLGEREIPEDRFFDLYDAEERRRTLDLALERVRETLRDRGQEPLLELLKDHAGAEGREPEDYAALARKFGLSVSDVRNRLTKVRTLLREALLHGAAQRSKDPEGELRELGLHAYLAKPGK